MEVSRSAWIKPCDNVTYFDSFWVRCITKVIEKFIGNEKIITNIYRTQAKDSIMFGYFCIRLYWVYADTPYSRKIRQCPLRLKRALLHCSLV